MLLMDIDIYSNNYTKWVVNVHMTHEWLRSKHEKDPKANIFWWCGSMHVEFFIQLYKILGDSPRFATGITK